jgi:hypothetical protein
LSRDQSKDRPIKLDQGKQASAALPCFSARTLELRPLSKLLEYDRQRVPLGWATIQNKLGATLYDPGKRESGTQHLQKAVDAFRTVERNPRGRSLQQQRDSDFAGIVHLSHRTIGAQLVTFAPASASFKSDSNHLRRQTSAKLTGQCRYSRHFGLL